MDGRFLHGVAFINKKKSSMEFGTVSPQLSIEIGKIKSTSAVNAYNV